VAHHVESAAFARPGRKLIGALALLAITLHASACASLPGGGGSGTAVERAMTNCVGSVVIGAIAGGVIGGIANGGRGAATGALVGGGAGSALCLVMVAVANEEDKQRILALERTAVADGVDKVDTYEREGVRRNVHTRVYGYNESLPATAVATKNTDPAKPKQQAPMQQAPITTGSANVASSTPGPRVCRYAETTIEVSGKGTATTDKQLYCRSASGDWEPVAAV